MRLLPALVLLTALLAGCGDSADGSGGGDSEAVPELGACRVLTPDDVAKPANDSATVDCAERHTAQTYAVGELPQQLRDAAYDDEALGAFAYETCSQKFQQLLGADESLVMRTIVSWAWFRPSEKAWDRGARWYRCDVFGGGEQSEEYVALPETAEGLLLGRPKDRWMVCATGPSVDEGTKVPCSQEHEWRAVTTIKVGEAKDEYPGDRIVEVTTRDYCSDSVGAWLGYPVTYDFGYTWFHEAEWQAGNRRSVCWARTPD